MRPRLVRAGLAFLSCSLILIISKLHPNMDLNFQNESLLGLDYFPDSAADDCGISCTSGTYGGRDLGNFIISGTLHLTLR